MKGTALTSEEFLSYIGQKSRPSTQKSTPFSKRRSQRRQKHRSKRNKTMRCRQFIATIFTSAEFRPESTKNGTLNPKQIYIFTRKAARSTRHARTPRILLRSSQRASAMVAKAPQDRRMANERQPSEEFLPHRMKI